MASTIPIDYTQRVKEIVYYFDAEFTSLATGAPGPDILEKCCEIFEVATRHRMITEKADKATLFQYGPFIGRLDFREALAKFLSEQYKHDVNCYDLILTSGATQGLYLTLTTLVDFEGVIFVDEVTYLCALRIMAQFPTMKVVAIPLTNDGVDVFRLRELVAAHQFVSKSKTFWGIYYTTTVYHNPTGITFTEDVCREIVNISREFELLVLAEDVYNLLSYTEDGIPPTRLFAYDRMEEPEYRGNVISNGSFSKFLSPGIRVGWMECPPRCIRLFASCGILDSCGATNNYMSGILTTLLDMGLLQSIFLTNRATFKDRMNTAIDLFRTHLPSDCKFYAPTGGYFIWIRFPDTVNVEELNAYADKHYGVSALPGNLFSTENKFKNCTRISIAFFGGEELCSKVVGFCRAYQDFARKLEIHIDSN